MDLTGKVVNFLGDSITEGACVGDLTLRYDNRIKAEYGLCAVHNYGISGTRLAYQRTPSAYPRFDLYFPGRIFDLCPDADVTVVYGGVNDYLHGTAPFGTETDETPDTFCGAVNFLMTALPARYPKMKFLFLTPARVCHTEAPDDTKPSTCPLPGREQRPLADYVDAILAAGRRHGIPVLDMYRDFPLKASDPETRAKYTGDGLHFNAAGHAFLADFVAQALKKL